MIPNDLQPRQNIIIHHKQHGNGSFSEGELTEKGQVFTPKFHLRCLAIHAHTVETSWCSRNVLTAQVKTEGIIQTDFDVSRGQILEAILRMNSVLCGISHTLIHTVQNQSMRDSVNIKLFNIKTKVFCSWHPIVYTVKREWQIFRKKWKKLSHDWKWCTSKIENLWNRSKKLQFDGVFCNLYWPLHVGILLWQIDSCMVEWIIKYVQVKHRFFTKIKTKTNKNQNKTNKQTNLTYLPLNS